MRLEQTRSPTYQRSPLSLSSRTLLSALSRVSIGQLQVATPDHSTRVFGDEQSGPTAAIEIRKPLAVTKNTLLNGAVGFAESYIENYWDTPDLRSLLFLMLLNQDQFTREWKSRFPFNLVNRLIHFSRSNNRWRSRKNIAYHYDLGNGFYKLWLDRSMSYSSALFEDNDEPLEQAQQRKYQRILHLIDPKPGEHILEIGCGWGGFAIEAAKRGCKVTGITLSREQLEFAKHRVMQSGMSELVELRLQDYRDVTERFDHVVSIEMFEAVGEAHWPTFFHTLRRCLRRDGRIALQLITMDHQNFTYYRKNPDFIQRYIFPGGMLPSVPVFESHAEKVGLKLERREFFGHHYVQTLSHWLERVDRSAEHIEALGYDRRFLRMWRFYLAYCFAGFRGGLIDLMQCRMTRA